jgi:hypothetical protein
MVVLSICDRRLKHFLDDVRTLLRRKRQRLQRIVDVLAANGVGYQPALLRGDACILQCCCNLHEPAP